MSDDLRFLRGFCPHGKCDCGDRCTSLDYIEAEARTPRIPSDPWGERIAIHRTAILAAFERVRP